MATETKKTPLDCLRCGVKMDFLGTQKLPEGIDWKNWIGSWGALLNTKKNYDVIGCESCGKVEFFIEGSIAEHQKEMQ